MPAPVDADIEKFPISKYPYVCMHYPCQVGWNEPCVFGERVQEYKPGVFEARCMWGMGCVNAKRRDPK